MKKMSGLTTKSFFFSLNFYSPSPNLSALQLNCPTGLTLLERQTLRQRKLLVRSCKAFTHQGKSASRQPPVGATGSESLNCIVPKVSIHPVPRLLALSTLWAQLPPVRPCEAVCAAFIGWAEEVSATGEIDRVRQLWASLTEADGFEKNGRGHRDGETPTF